MSKLTESRVKIWWEVFTMVWKSIFSGAILIAFFIVLHFFIYSSTIFETAKYGALELFLMSTVYVGFKHYFPLNKEFKQNEK